MRLFQIIGILIHYLVNGLLGFVLCVSLFLIIVLWQNGEVPIPASVKGVLDEELAKEGFRLEADELHLDVRGMVLAKNLRIYSTENSEPFFDAELALAKFGLFRLLIGDFVPTEVVVDEGAFYCPAVVSPQGKREEVIQNIFIKANRQANEWKIDLFILEILNARVQISGNVFTPLPGLDTEPTKAPPTIAKTNTGDHFVSLYMEVCRNILDLKETLDQFKDPIIRVELESVRKGPLELMLHTYNAGMFDEKNQITLGASTCRVKATLDVDGILRPDGFGFVCLDSLKWDEEVETGYSEMLVKMDNGLQGIYKLPLNAELFAYNIKAWGLSFDGAFASLDLRGLQDNPDGDLSGQVHLKSGKNWLTVSGPFKPSDQSGNLELVGLWNPLFFLGSTAIPKDDIPENINVAGRPRWRAQVDFLPGFQPAEVTFDVRFNELSYEEIHLEAARVHGKIGADDIDLEHVDLMGKDFRVQGNYQQNFQNNKYRFQAAGTVWPKDLDKVIDDDWWDELWSGITFNGIPPNAAIDMSGRYGADGKENNIYGSANLEKVSYQGQAIDTAFTRIWQTPKHLDLFEFGVTSPKGKATVYLHWDYLPSGRRNYLSFRALTQMDLMQAATLASPEVIPYAKMFPNQKAPSLDVAGMIYGEDSEKPGDLFLKAGAHFPGKFEFEEIYFENGSFICDINPQTITVSRGRFGLGSGRAALHTIIDRQTGDKLFVESAKLSINKAKLYGLYEAIPFLRSAREKQIAQEKKEAKNSGTDPIQKSFEERYAGDVDFYIDTKGELPDLETFSGDGQIVLKGANLGQLHLLGGLSSFLFSIGLHLGTLEFSNATSDFSMAYGNIHFPNVEITGATGLINANGNFFIPKESLDFAISLHPFGNVETPVVSQVFSILSPISDSLEVELSGSLTKPEYQYQFRPLGFLTGQSQIENPNATISNPMPPKTN
ncbi:MAG: hypothetical protein AAFX93_10285 [Verrucomicrobiota bacterium]